MKIDFLILLVSIVPCVGLTACTNSTVAIENVDANTVLKETGNTGTTSQMTTNSTAIERRLEDTEKKQEVIRGTFAVQNIKSGKNLRPNPEVSSAEKFVANGNGIVLYPHAEWKCMTWQFTHVEDNVYQLQNLYTNKTFQPWAIILKENGDEPIGSIAVVHKEDAVEMVHIGYCIGKRWWKQGITSEALASLVQFLFEEVGINRIESRHDPRNPNSGKVMMKCGLKYEGTHRDADWNNQGRCDSAMHAILANDYNAAK
jgi:Acetyltransferases, including N-acetylases of ribosomal proteins